MTETPTPPEGQSQEVAVHASSALAIKPGQQFWDDKQLAALRQLGVNEAPSGDLAVFLHYAQRTGLDPFSRQIYMIARKDMGDVRWTIQAGIDALRIVAQRSGEYAGQVGPEWCGPDGQWRDVWLDTTTTPAAARVGVLRRGFTQPLYAVALFHEYAGTKRDGSLTRMWSEKGALMIAKCAEALALRKAFPMDLSGIYTAEEMAMADTVTDGGATTAPTVGGTGQPVAEPGLCAADPEQVDHLRTQVLLSTEVKEGTERLLADLWKEGKEAGALNCPVAVPPGWVDGFGADEVPLSRLIVGAREAHGQGIAHGDTLADADGVVLEQQRCAAVRKKDGARCGYLEGHRGRHDYADPEKEKAAAEQARPDDAPVCGEADGAGWPCLLEPGHDGDHDGADRSAT